MLSNLCRNVIEDIPINPVDLGDHEVDPVDLSDHEVDLSDHN
jgi:hypothetical protein